MNEPTHLDLFSGIGGFSLAAEACGFKTIGFSEIDPYASSVLSKWWPTVTNYGDIRNITKESIGHVDLITGGFPCQPFSVAGQRRGDSDERFLWPELLRVVSEIRPTFALFENVPGLLTIDGGRTFNRILSDISSIGYDLLWNCVPACAVGANHRRDRLWIVAYSSDSGIKSMREWENSTVENVSNTRCKSERISEKSKRPSNNASGCDWWSSEPSICGVAYGVPKRLDRLRCLGNSIVPQVAKIFLQEIRKQF